MNCQKFEDVVTDIVRDQIMDADLQSDAMQHGRQCVSCEARLADERAITIQMRELAVLTQAASASPRLQESLLEAFERQSFIKTSSANTHRRRYWVAAIAASLLIAFGLFVARAWQPEAKKPATVVAQNGPEPSKLAGTVPTSVFSSDGSLVRSERVPARGKRLAISLQDRKNAEVKDTDAGNRFDDLIATDFIPVTYGGAANLDAGGQIVRVELPRSRLASFGLPVNMDRADEKVKADVLIGVDGLAHAIRFVGNRTASDVSK
jgi:hypothetical protein